jgi:transposase
MSVQTLSGQRLIVASDGTLELSADDAEPTRIALAFEAGRDGFWLARWLRARGVEAHVIHPSSVAVSREHRRAKTDRLDTELLKRGFLGWLRGERGHCTMARTPTIAEEDAKRPNRERECLVGERTLEKRHRIHLPQVFGLLLVRGGDALGACRG